VDGEDQCNLPYNKTIFVMEDVDAASQVVQRRAENVTDKEAMQAAALMKAAMKAAKTKTKEEDEGEGGKEAKDASTGDDESESKGKTKGKAFGPMPAFGRNLFGGDDDLNLAGLLNVLDGVVDTPNRIVIMTTNHPEKLDPALIRPGRINKKIYMGRICIDQALQMMSHYFGSVKASTEALLRSIFVDEALSPAELETACADFENPEDLTDFLAAKFLAAERAVAGSQIVKTGSYSRTVPQC
jgi:chaperone BCS1